MPPNDSIDGQADQRTYRGIAMDDGGIGIEEAQGIAHGIEGGAPHFRCDGSSERAHECGYSGGENGAGNREGEKAVLSRDESFREFMGIGTGRGQIENRPGRRMLFCVGD